MEELQWCPHLKIDPWPIVGYTVAHIQATGAVLVAGQGKIRVICEQCAPDYLDAVLSSAHSCSVDRTPRVIRLSGGGRGCLES